LALTNFRQVVDLNTAIQVSFGLFDGFSIIITTWVLEPFEVYFQYVTVLLQIANSRQLTKVVNLAKFSFLVAQIASFHYYCVLPCNYSF
jgi:hypothetical protein